MLEYPFMQNDKVSPNESLILVGSSMETTGILRPENQKGFPEDDARHWFDLEYMHWQVEKKPMPDSPMDGPEGKYVLCNIPTSHPYMDNFREGMEEVAGINKVDVEFIYTGKGRDAQSEYADLVIEKQPDLAIHMMPEFSTSDGIYHKIYNAGIPIICSNMMPAREDLPYILSWTGPHDWEMSRELARTFAELMDYKGGYALIQQFEGTYCNIARTWGVITELKKVAPDMTCLDFCSTNMDQSLSEMTVEKWIDGFGESLKGIVSADSLIVQKGIDRALRKSGRQDVICVSHWSPPEALRFIKNGTLKATTYQSGFIDGTLSMQTAVDWFSGFEIPPVCYMPIHVITEHDVDLFLSRKNRLPVIDYLPYAEALKLGDAEGLRQFFSEMTGQFRECSLITSEYCSGVAIEILSRFISISAGSGFHNSSLTGCHNPAMLTKRILHQKSFDKTILWLEDISLRYSELINSELPSKVSIDQIIDYVRIHFQESLSLKTLSHQFNLSAAYLGQLYKKTAGCNFSSHLNTIRVENAKILLHNPQLKEYEVARNVGYTDASYFFRIFKKHTGMNPSEYRVAVQNEEEDT